MSHVSLLEVLAKGDVLGLLRVLRILLSGCRAVSIFNQKRGISNNWSASFCFAYFAKSLWVI